MTKEGQPASSGFWLDKYSNYGHEKLKTYRVILGDPIDAKDRETFKPPKGSMSPDFWNKSGSIGFMDISVSKGYVPKQDAESYLNPNNEVEHEYPWEFMQLKEYLSIEAIGIEPAFRRKGYAKFLMQRAEEIALEWGLETVVAKDIENPVMMELNQRLGYKLFEGGTNAVKYLTH